MRLWQSLTEGYCTLHGNINIIELCGICVRTGVEIIKAKAGKNHVQTLLSMPPKLSDSQFTRYSKETSGLMLFDRLQM
ncbi:hypothetical protein GIX45_25360 [Erwinia sp. CPCC 100877]|nr:hypothetical protein [Erwinia sp. CPCC 100877]